MRGNEALTAAGRFQFKESFASNRKILRVCGLFKRQKTFPIRPEHFRRGAFLISGAKFDVRVNRQVHGLLGSAAAKIRCGLLNEGNPGCVERKVVRKFVERRGEGENLALPDLAFE